MSSLTITTIQSAIFWEDKTANLKMFEEKIASVACKTELVVLPEMFSTGFTMNTALAETMEGETVQWMQNIAAQHKIIITGSIIIKDYLPDGNTAFYNRLIWMLPNGQFGFYDKRHLFAFAEENNFFTAGSKRLIASVKGWKINLQVCYDLRFPVWARQDMLPDEAPEYDILINVANWPAARCLAWKTLLQARAIENQCYVIGVNRVGPDGKQISYSGNSMVINPLGEILYHKEKDEDIFTITLKKDSLLETRKRFPFLVDKDTFKIFS